MKKFSNFTPIKLTAILAAVFACISLENCKAQSSYKVIPVPSKYQISASDLSQYQQQADAEKSGAYDLTKSLPQGYVTDGTVDYTQNLQIGMNANAKVIFPNFPVLVNAKGLAVKSNSVIIFGDKSKIKLKPTDAGSYQIFKINNVQNVKVYFANIQGDRYSHIGTGGEWGMGINISGSSNVQLINPKVTYCWGDGIYLGKTGDAVNTNIDIIYAQLDLNRRNGISIICADGLNIKSPVISNTEGTLPMSGIDIEPNDNKDEINNVNVDNAVTFNNANCGIIFELDRLTGQNLKNVNVKIENHVDDGSAIGMNFLLAKQPNNNAFAGNVSITNPTWKNNKKNSFVFTKSFKGGLNFHFSNVRVMKRDESGNDVTDNNKFSDAKRVISRDLNANMN